MALPRVLAYAAPSVLTLTALACSLTAMKVAFLQRFSEAAGLIIAAAFCDALDGHVARLLNAVTVFGGELDSLGDLVNFGVAPALVVYAWADEGKGDAWDTALWVSCVVFCQCCALRLARFNCGPSGPAMAAAAAQLAQLHKPEQLPAQPAAEPQPESQLLQQPLQPEQPPVQEQAMEQQQQQHQAEGQTAVSSGAAAAKDSMRTIFICRSKFFSGVPAPMGALMALLPVFWQLDTGHSAFARPRREVAVPTLLVTALLMVSRLKTLSSKMFVRDPKRDSHLRISSPWEGMLKCAGLAGAVAAASLYSPWRLVLAMQFVYLLSLCVGPIVYRHFAQ